MKPIVKIGIIASILAVAAVVVIVLISGRKPEPVYQGRGLSAWLADMDSASPDVRSKARDAFRKMGETVVPALVEIIREDTKPAGSTGNQAYNALIVIARVHPSALSALNDLLYVPGATGDAALSLAALNPTGIPALTNGAN